MIGKKRLLLVEGEAIIERAKGTEFAPEFAI